MRLYIAICLWAASSYALALELPESTAGQVRFMPEDAIERLAGSGFTADYDFEGIVGLSNCSGSLVRLDTAIDEDAAIVMTNGHCVRMIPAGHVIINQSSSRSFSVLDTDAPRLVRCGRRGSSMPP